MPISFPGLVVSGGVVSAAYQNSIRNALIAVYAELFAPQSNVDYGGRNLSNLGVVTFAAGGYIGSNLAFGGTAPQAAIDLKAGGQIQLNSPNNGNQFRLGFTVNDLSLRLSFNGTGVAVFGSDGTFYPPYLDITNATGTRHIRLAAPAANEGYNIYRDGPSGILTFSGEQSGFVGYTFKVTAVDIMRFGYQRLWIRPDSLPSYSTNAAAVSAGRVAGDIYQVTSSNPRQLAIVF